MNVFNAWAPEFVNQHADVHAEASIGNNTHIWRFASVAGGARIGSGCTIGQYVHIGPKVIVGNGCKIQNGAQLFEGVTLEDDVFVGPCAVFTNVTTPRAFINRRAEFKPTFVKKGASIGANATILCGVTIGEYAMIAAGAVVTRDVKAHSLVVSSPARHVSWVCRCGVHVSLAHENSATDPRQTARGKCIACGTILVGTYNTVWSYDVTDMKVADAETT